MDAQTQANAEYIVSALSQTRPAKYKAFVMLFDEASPNREQRLVEAINEVINRGNYSGARLEVIVRPAPKYQSLLGVVVATGQDEDISRDEVYGSMFSSIFKVTSDAGIMTSSIPEPFFIENQDTGVFADFKDSGGDYLACNAYYGEYIKKVG